MVTIWRTPSLLLLIAGSLTQKSSGFMPYSFVHNTARKQSTLMQMSTKDAVEQNRAVEKLEKLLKRQQAELKQTEELLRTLNTLTTVDEMESSFDDSFNTLTLSEHHTIGENQTESSSVASAMDVANSLNLGVDYGFISRSEGNSIGDMVGGLPVNGYDTTTDAFEDYGPPTNFVDLGSKAFMRNLDAIKGEYKNEGNKKLTKKQKLLHEKLNKLTLNSTAIWEREKAGNHVEAPFIIMAPYLILCHMLDFVFEGRYVPSRFYLLETVARMPYFSYIAMLHLYETLGWWRRSADVKRVHFAEEWNEFHHLLIMESLGGDQQWWVRFCAQHAALAYYTALVVLWMISPTLGYKFSELLETHAVNTYSQFLDENEELLSELPASAVAVEYYGFGSSDPLFGEYQTSALAKGEEPRRPGESMKTLHDVFSAIRDDEGDHVSTMKACLDPNVAVQSPAIEKQFLVGGAIVAAAAYFVSTGDTSMFEGSGTELLDSVGEETLTELAGFAAMGEQMLTEDSNEFITDLIIGGTAFNSLGEMKAAVFEALEALLKIFF